LFNKNVIREYTLDYYTNNKKDFENQKFEDYKKNFVVSEQMLKDVVSLATKSGVKFKENEYNKSKTFIMANIKAYIARSAWGNSGFYPIINETDEIYTQGLKQFNKAAQMEKMTYAEQPKVKSKSKKK
jgi:carboxyl-terminal processing protease